MWESLGEFPSELSPLQEQEQGGFLGQEDCANWERHDILSNSQDDYIPDACQPQLTKC